MASSFDVIFVVIDESVLGNGCVGEVIQSDALATHSAKSITSLAGVLSSAGGVNLVAKSFSGFSTASYVRGAGIVRHVSGFLDKFIRAGVLQIDDKNNLCETSCREKVQSG